MKKVAIIYASKYKTTKKLSVLMADTMEEKFDVTLLPLRDNPNPKIDKYDIVILGTPIYFGRPMKEMEDFCQGYQSLLIQKRLGLFVCGMESCEELQKKYLDNAYGSLLHEYAVVEQFMSGEIIFHQLNSAEQVLAAKYLPPDAKVTSISYNGIKKFADTFSNICYCGIEKFTNYF